MRPHLKSVMLVTLAVLPAAAGCSSSGPVAAGAPVRGGNLRYDLESDPKCIDPQQSPTGSAQVATRDVLDGLLTQDPKTGAIKPWLATSWKVSGDARRFTFTLRPGVTFSDGAPFDAGAVKANLDRIVDPKTGSLFAVSLLRGYTGSTVTDPRTVTVSFKEPSAPFLQALTTGFLGIESPKTFAAGPKATCAKVVGSGPFTMDGYTPNKSVVLRRRTGYQWAPPSAAHTGDTYLDSVTLAIIPDGGIRVGRLRSGQTDVIAGVPTLRVPELKRAGLRMLTAQQPGLPFSLVFNQRRAPLDDRAVRQAVSKTIDVAQIVNAVYQNIYPGAYSLLTPATPGYARTLDAAPDPAGAARLLDQAGWTGRDGLGYRTRNGNRLTISWPYRTPVDSQTSALQQLVQQQLKKVGVEVVLRPLDIGAAITALTTGDYGITQQSMVRSDGDLLRSFFLSTSPSNFSHVRLPEVDRLLSQAAAVLDGNRRGVLYAQVQRALTADATIFPVFDYVSLIGAAKPVGGTAFTADGLPHFYDTSISR